MTENEYQLRIEQLEREVAELKTKLTAKQKTTRYGLVWEDVPEAFEKEYKELWGKYAGNVRPRWQAAPINSSVLMPAARHTTTASIVSNGMILRESTVY